MFNNNYIEFQTRNLKGELTIRCGTDGTIPFDGRWGIDRIREHALNLALKMNKHFGAEIERIVITRKGRKSTYTDSRLCGTK